MISRNSSQNLKTNTSNQHNCRNPTLKWPWKSVNSESSSNLLNKDSKKTPTVSKTDKSNLKISSKTTKPKFHLWRTQSTSWEWMKRSSLPTYQKPKWNCWEAKKILTKDTGKLRHWKKSWSILKTVLKPKNNKSTTCIMKGKNSKKESMNSKTISMSKRTTALL